MMIWTDPVRLPWTADEREELRESDAIRHLLEELPAGVHGRPEGAGESPVVLGIWTYDIEPVEPEFPIVFDPAYAEIVIRGLSRMIPALGGYAQRLPRSFVDGGYYTKTEENRFLACPLPVEGAYLLGGSPATGSCPPMAPPISWPIISRAPAARLCGRLPPGPVRRSRLPGPPDELGGFGAALVRDEAQAFKLLET